MSILTSWFSQLFIEMPVRRANIPQMAIKLEDDGDHILARFMVVQDSLKNRAALCQIMGIERWAQSRLQVVLGDPLVMDHYVSYRPEDHISCMSLAEMFRETRHTTIILAEMIYQLNAEKTRVPHNLLGPITVVGWLRYINYHTNLISRKIK
jgi:hypothetical protein